MINIGNICQYTQNRTHDANSSLLFPSGLLTIIMTMLFHVNIAAVSYFPCVPYTNIAYHYMTHQVNAILCLVLFFPLDVTLYTQCSPYKSTFQHYIIVIPQKMQGRGIKLEVMTKAGNNLRLCPNQASDVCLVCSLGKSSQCTHKIIHRA